MDTFEDIIQAIQDDLTIDDNSSLYPLALVKRYANRAKAKAEGLFRWPQLIDSKETSSKVSQEYYEYPDRWRTNSIYRVEMDDLQYGEDPDGSPMLWNDYLAWRRDSGNASSTDKKWGNHGRLYFIFPVPTTNGSNNITIWGLKVTPDLSADGDTTVFSYNMPEGNEAIVREAVAMLKKKGQDSEGGEFVSVEAKNLLVVAFGKLKDEMSKYESVQPLFNVGDMFGNSAQDLQNKIGELE